MDGLLSTADSPSAIHGSPSRSVQLRSRSVDISGGWTSMGWVPRRLAGSWHSWRDRNSRVQHLVGLGRVGGACARRRRADLYATVRCSGIVGWPRSRPDRYVAMLMEPHVADWHVHRAGGPQLRSHRGLRHPVRFPKPPTVAEYENASDGYADVVELQLPRELPTLAPGQEWRMVWDSALDRAEIGHGVESRFDGHRDLLRPPRSAPGLAVLAARSASAGDQSGAGLGFPAARSAHRADDDP